MVSKILDELDGVRSTPLIVFCLFMFFVGFPVLPFCASALGLPVIAVVVYGLFATLSICIGLVVLSATFRWYFLLGKERRQQLEEKWAREKENGS